jgi:adenosine deaminase
MERIDEKKEREWLQGLPKTEIHVHLEGSIPLDALWQLMEKYGGDPEVPDIAALRARFRYKDFPTFIQTWIWKNTFIRAYEDFTFFSEAVAREFKRQNILYVEAHVTPPEFARLGLTVQGVTTAVHAGLARVPGIDVRLIVDFCRDFGPKSRSALAARNRTFLPSFLSPRSSGRENSVFTQPPMPGRLPAPRASGPQWRSSAQKG